jgi:1-acyl-sn-glycerol-3-phosphate acyltransferase
MGCIPIKRTGSPLPAIRVGVETLREGRLLTIFPEGSRSVDGRLGRGLPGIATLALKSRALVIPVAIFGTYEALPRGARFLRRARMRVRFGRPLDFSRERWRDNEAMTRVIMDSIRALQDA